MALPDYSIPPPEERATIVCLYCDKPQEVGRRALTVTCRFCNKALKLEDIRITQYQARRTVAFYEQTSYNNKEVGVRS